MSKKYLRSYIATAFVCFVSLFYTASAQAWVLQDMGGERTNLLEFVGQDKWTIVMLWQLECVACEEQKPALKAFHEKYKDNFARVVAVSSDGMERKGEVDQRIEKNADNYINLMAFTDVYQRQYQELSGKSFRTWPTFMYFDPNGKLLGSQTGYIDLDEITRSMKAASGVSN